MSRRRGSSICEVALLLHAAASVGLGQSDSTKTRRLAEIQQQFPCPPSGRVRIHVSVQTFADAACSLTHAAITQIGRGAARHLGVEAKDTAVVTDALVVDFTFRGEDTPDVSYWAVTLAFRDRGPSVDVFFYWLGDSVRVVNGHPWRPAGSQRPAPKSTPDASSKTRKWV